MQITMFHGGTEIVSHPLVNVGRPNLDFGPGLFENYQILT